MDFLSAKCVHSDHSYYAYRLILLQVLARTNLSNSGPAFSTYWIRVIELNRKGLIVLPVRLSPRPSRSIDLGDVPETNGPQCRTF